MVTQTDEYNFHFLTNITNLLYTGKGASYSFDRAEELLIIRGQKKGDHGPWWSGLEVDVNQDRRARAEIKGLLLGKERFTGQVRQSSGRNYTSGTSSALQWLMDRRTRGDECSLVPRQPAMQGTVAKKLQLTQTGFPRHLTQSKPWMFLLCNHWHSYQKSFISGSYWKIDDNLILVNG